MCTIIKRTHLNIIPSSFPPYLHEIFILVSQMDFKFLIFFYISFLIMLQYSLKTSFSLARTYNLCLCFNQSSKTYESKLWVDSQPQMEREMNVSS